MGNIFAGLCVVALVAATGGCSTGSPPPGASIEVDRATCEKGLTTLVTVDAKARARALAVGADGTVFVSMWDSSVGSVYSIAPSGGAPVRVADAQGAVRMWVDGATLWMAALSGSLYSVPTTGGTANLVGQIPGTDNVTRLAGGFALDATHLYLTATRVGAANLEVWSIARIGGATRLLFSSSNAKFADAYMGPLAAAGDALYFTTQTSGYSDLLRIPKVGGSPTVVRSDVYSASMLVPFSASFYSNAGTQLARFPLDPATPSTPIAGVGFGMVDVGTGDDAGAYAGFVVGAQPASSPWALAPLPKAAEPATALGCTETLDGGGLLGLDMALTATHVYALITDVGPPQRFMIVRAAR